MQSDEGLVVQERRRQILLCHAAAFPCPCDALALALAKPNKYRMVNDWLPARSLLWFSIVDWTRRLEAQLRLQPPSLEQW